MTIFKAKFTWDDQNEAAYRKQIHWLQYGEVKVLKNEDESDENFINRAESILINKINSVSKRNLCPVTVISKDYK